jgi:hypothetical protein
MRLSARADAEPRYIKVAANARTSARRLNGRKSRASAHRHLLGIGSRAGCVCHPAVAYCQGTPLRNEIEARDADKLEVATDYAATEIAKRPGSGEVAAKIQAHVIVAVV